MKRCLLVVVATASFATPAFAGGQFAGDNGSQGMQRAGAFVAKADDPTALYFNPAGLYKAIGKQMFVGVNVVTFFQSFQRDGEYQVQNLSSDATQPGYIGDPYPRVQHAGQAQPVPFFAFTIPHDKFAFSVGVFAPHGYGRRNYPDTVVTSSGATAPAPQRYDVVSQAGIIAFPSVGASYELTKELSIGGRASWGFAQIETRKFAQGLPNRGESPGRDTDASISVKDSSIYTFGLGVHYHPSETFEMGLAYTAPIDIHAVGTANTVLGDDLRNLMPGEVTQIIPVPDSEARCAPGGSVGAIKTCVDLTMPQTATLGMRWILRDNLGREAGDLELDVRWENWSAVDQYSVVIDGQNSTVQIPVNPAVIRHGFKDVYSVRLGGAVRFFRKNHHYEFRYGVAYETAATPESWSRLDVDTAQRFTIGLGVSVDFGTWRFDIGAAYIDSPTRQVHDEPLANKDDMASRVQPDITAPLLPADQQPYHPFNAGSYKSHYWIGSFGLLRSW